MDLEDFFENKKKHHRTHDMRNYHRGDSYSKFYQGKNERFDLLGLLNNIKNNKKIRVLLLAILIFLIVVIIVVIAVLFPLLMNLFSYLSQNGISGLVEKAMELLNNLWNGTN